MHTHAQSSFGFLFLIQHTNIWPRRDCHLTCRCADACMRENWRKLAASREWQRHNMYWLLERTNERRLVVWCLCGSWSIWWSESSPGVHSKSHGYTPPYLSERQGYGSFSMSFFSTHVPSTHELIDLYPTGSVLISMRVYFYCFLLWYTTSWERDDEGFQACLWSTKSQDILINCRVPTG
jgi:hypothetical protein